MMEEQMNNVPKLRFPEFNGEWEENKLGDVADIKRGASPRPIADKRWFDESSTVGWVRISDVTRSNKVLNVTEQYLSEAGIKKSRFIPKGNLIMSICATIGKPIYTGFDVCIHDGFVVFDKLSTKKEFMYYLLNGIQRNWVKYGQPGIQLNLNSDIVSSEKVALPVQLSEQQKIADFLTAVDKRIEQLEEKKRLLTEYKKGVMQQIFSQQIRFKDDNGNSYPDWEEKRLGGVASFFSGGTPLTTNRSFYEGEIPFIKSGEINAFGTEQYLSQSGVDGSSAKIVEKGDLLYALYGATSGEVGISKIKGAINQAVLCIRSQQNTSYLYNFLRFNKEHILNKYLQGGQGNLSADIIKKLLVPLSSIEEQQKIADFLTSIDNKTEQVDAQLEQAKTFKKGLLQQMFV
jgi:type I restriction enzyme S subunit